ncbi:putative FBD-associated F-box protein At5g56390 [Humulus lupulus]|uniref:putative FBD-associated F-box protein At5g56390 n=1 Tax=Humulus lupulus TaxID=3486 RepID=UPI002B4143B9|nr:putative FBD-associated F-box protein At5g56390 [Humulus lupulus]XP_062091738.1 putative FBD-associated F-box protein At5g56390 [Humulus lupulus]
MAVAEEKISLLPDELIQESLSFLPTVDVVRTCLLLKCWRHMWYSVPTLSFSDEMTSFERFSRFVDSYIEHRNKIKELHICLSSEEDEDDGFLLHYYALPKALVNATHFTTLELEGVELDTSASRITFPSLKSLILRNVQLTDNTNNDVISNFVLGCPLQKLILISCFNLKYNDLCLVSSTIKFLQLKDIADQVQLLQIEAKNLEFLELVDVHFDKVNFSGCKKILNLSFSYVCDSSSDLLVTELPLLENLTFNICSTLKDIKISSQKNKETRDENGMVIKIDFSSHLPSFCYEASINLRISIEPDMLTKRFIVLNRHENYDPKLTY